MRIKEERHKLTKKKIKSLLAEGVYGYNEIFDRLYPTFMGHYYTLRRLIAEVKNG